MAKKMKDLSPSQQERMKVVMKQTQEAARLGTTNKKRAISPKEEADLRDALQVATLAALMDSRRWEPGDLAFQGGTSLHLAHGSPRFSEDLDFMIRGGLSPAGLSKEVEKRLRKPAGAAKDLQISVSPMKADRNPHSFFVTLSGPYVLGSVKVKVELWQTKDTALNSLKLLVSKVQTPSGSVFVPTLTKEEIRADKVFALGARDRVKPRDVYDLWWLDQQGVRACSPEELQTRLEIYPTPSGSVSESAARWMAGSERRLDELRDPEVVAFVSKDLSRWLPSSHPVVNLSIAQLMVQSSIGHLEAARGLMQDSLSENFSNPLREVE